MDEFDPHVALEGLHDLRTFVLAHEPGVDVHAGELRTDRGVHEGCRHCRVDATRQSADRTLGSDLPTNRSDLILDDRPHRPRPRCADEIVKETFDQVLSALAVHDLRVVLHAPNLSGIVFDDRHRCIRRTCSGHEPLGQLRDGIEVTHPHRCTVTDRRRQQRRRCSARDRRATIFSATTARHLATQLLGDQLTPITDAKDRNPELVDPSIQHGRALHVNAGRSTREDDRDRVPLGDGRGGDGVRDDLRIHLGLAHASRNELCVLCTEVDDEDRRLWCVRHDAQGH